MFGFEIREEWEAEVARLLSTLTWPLAGRGRNGEWILLSCPGEGNLFTTLQGEVRPVQAGCGADVQVLTWASCCPASMGTCRSSSQSILFPRRRMTTPSGPDSCV